jgi:hypothetical protein
MSPEIRNALLARLDEILSEYEDICRYEGLPPQEMHDLIVERAAALLEILQARE